MREQYVNVGWHRTRILVRLGDRYGLCCFVWRGEEKLAEAWRELRRVVERAGRAFSESESAPANCLGRHCVFGTEWERFSSLFTSRGSVAHGIRLVGDWTMVGPVFLRLGLFTLGPGPF